MRRVFKLVFLFVGTVIGAGFATGSEIVLFFKNCGYLSVLFSSIVIGLLSVVFCYYGRLKNKSNLLKNITKIVVFFCSIVTYCVMISGASELIYNQFCIKYFGILTSFVVAILMLYDIRIVKLLNLIIVPLIILLMLVILIVSGGEIYSGFNFATSLKYAGMNMLLGGYFMSEEGKDLSHKQIALTGFLVAFTMMGLMSICYVISMQAVASNMPVFEVARGCGLGLIASIVVFLAIFTTLIGSGRAFADMIMIFYPNKLLIFVLVFALGIYFDGLNFSALVSFCYTAIGKIGFVVSVVICANLLYNCLANSFLKYKKQYLKN